MRHISTTESTAPRRRTQGGYGLIGGLVSLFFGIILTIIALRFVFRLLGANAGNGLVSWIYDTSAPLVSPFFGIFNHDINVTTGRFELETLLALIVYGIIASLIMGLFARSGRSRSA